VEKEVPVVEEEKPKEKKNKKRKRKWVNTNLTYKII
jgi:hypothetical protein